ncbi:MAG: DEAD/DEAH box helicase [Acidimicrobiales bacterium]|nr:DEAD/DEAH box helicase [Acidimicrobiales bacterium]
MQRWIWDQGWTSLHDAQEQAIGPILDGDRDVIISAATAAGKTEAAFLPICSTIATQTDETAAPSVDPWTSHDPWAEPTAPALTGIQVLYLSPLKALINDQYDRLDQLCDTAHVAVHRWHGDVAGDAKKKALTNPSGVLLITPESLEALFVNRGTEVPNLLARLQYVVVDELHSFLSTPRGAQLQSLLNRVELALRRRPPRIGLSATLGDMQAAAAFLRPNSPDAVQLINSTSDGQEIRLQVRGYRCADPLLSQKDAAEAEAAGRPVTVEDTTDGDQLMIADHLFRTMRGADNLVFANSRRDVEIYADLLAQRCESERLPNEFFPHHGSLSRELREDVERFLKDRTRPVTVVCTSTLEMGIDIGSMTAVAQIGTPPSVAALRQRLGRSGRRDEPSTLRAYITEDELDGKSTLVDELRCGLVQTTAMVELLLEKWVEPPADPGLNLSTLIQQILSVIAQHGGATAAEIHQSLCGPGPFDRVDPQRFARLLRAMATKDLITQVSDGTLLHGRDGERAVNHYSFYAAFKTPQEWRLVANGRPLGTLPVDHPIIEGAFLIFSGRRWKITGIDAKARVIELTRAHGGKPPVFGGEGAPVGDRIRQKMVSVYEADESPPWLDRSAADLLAEGRAAWRRHDLAATPVIRAGNDTLVLPWLGDHALVTTVLALASAGIEAAREGPSLRVFDCPPDQLQAAAETLLRKQALDPLRLARELENTDIDKWDYVLDPDLSAEATAARLLDTAGARTILSLITTATPGDTARPAPSGAQRPPSRGGFNTTEFCVLDLETTGFSPRLGDRVVEIATTRVRGDGTVIDEWSTLVNPERDIGATHIHGIAAGDVLDAPTFADITGDLLQRLDGAVLTAHNLRFDRDFLTAEFDRSGHPLPPLPALCTLQLVTRLDPATASRKLAVCCARIGHPIPHEHAALHDARAAAALLLAYLPVAERAGATELHQLGCHPTNWPTAWRSAPPSGRRHERGAASNRRDDQASYVASLVARLDDTGSSDPDIVAYHDVLDRALEDRRITELEARVLNDTAVAWGLTPAQVQKAHRAYLEGLVTAALADDIITDRERADIELVARLLQTDVPGTVLRARTAGTGTDGR